MKNTINYFYNLKINKYKKNNLKFTFEINDEEYEFVEYYGDISSLTSIYRIVKGQGKQCHEIIINKNNMILTFYNNKSYILIKKNKYRKSNNLLYDIISFSGNVILDNKLKWKELWSYKLEYFKQRIEEKDNLNLKLNFSYYAALCENAISLINYVKEENLKFGISHIRIESEDDLVNPLNMIIDSRVRDIAEYIKINFFKHNIIKKEIFNLINDTIFSRDEIIILLSRLLYPSYFFDECELFFEDDLVFDKLKNIIKKNLEYEKFLKNLYIEINNHYNIPQIEFLEI